MIVNRILQFAFFMCAFTAAAAALAAPSVTGVRIGVHDGERTRFVLDIDAEVEFNVFTLASPNRVVIDFPELDWSAPAASVIEGRGLVEQFRVGMFQPGVFRVVLDVNSPLAVERTFTLQPQGPFQYRIVLDLRPVDIATFRQNTGSRGAVPFSPAGAPAVPRAPDRSDPRPVVVIDAGHGGVDPGAISPGQLYEKTVTLAVARELRDRLQAGGRYRPILTRDRDIFLQLRDRVQIARDADADLFISVHADSNPSRSIRGASVYTLSETASDREAARLAATENRSDVIAGIDLDTENAEVATILIDLAQRETMNYSATFAEILGDELSNSVRTLRNSHRFAGFRVLKAPDVPSVLVELGYLSNRDDERMLQSSAGQRRIAEAIAAAVDSYFTQLQR